MPFFPTKISARIAKFSAFACCALLGAVGSVAVAAQQDDRALVLHTLKRLQLISDELAGELVTTGRLIRDVQQAHSYNVRFSDLRQLQSADLLVWMGPEFEHYLSKPLLALQPRVMEHAWLSAEPGHSHDSAELHIWLDASAVAGGATQLAEAFAQLRPTQRKQLSDKASQFSKRIQGLDQQIAIKLRPFKGKGVVVDHRGLEVFLQRYGIRYLGSLQSDNHSSLSLKQARRLRQEVQMANAECVVLTQGHSAEGLLQIFSGLEVSTTEVDIMGAKASSYTELLTRLANDIAVCLSEQTRQ